MGQIVDVNDLSRSFGSKRALDGVSFHAVAGQVYGLVGANGAGKTTLLKHLLGLLRAATGSVRVFGLDPVRDPVGVLGRIGYLSEERELPEWMRVDELMDYTRAFHPTWDGSYARELLESFALDPSKKVKELSKGMRAQAGLIAAAAHRPELLILDEPSSGLDAIVRRDILDAIVRAVADDGRTVILSSHLLDEVERMSDHVTLMHHGRVTLGGALDDVRRGYQRSRVRFVEHFERPPSLETALALEGGGRTWSVVHSGSLEQFHHSVLALGGEVVESRNATLWDRLVNLFRFPCPTSSATRAQVWFDLKSSGLPLLAIGVALAIVILLLGAVSNRIDAAIFDGFRAYVSCSNSGCFYARPMVVFFSTLSPLIVLFFAGNAFGIRRRQGRSYVSAFEATQAYGAAHLAALKLLVRSACFLAALLAVGVSAWTSLSILGDEVFIQMWKVPLSSQLRGITGAVAALTGYEQLALVVVAAVGVVIWVAAFAVLGALWTRYSHRANIAASSLLLSGLALALLALADRNGIVSPFVFDALFAAARWIVFGAMVFMTVYVFWSGFAERVLTIRYAGGAVAISVAFGAAWLTALHMAGVQLAGMSATNAISVVSPALLPLMASVLAPWSLSRVRHL